jgi:IS30 family transposase
LDERIEIEVGLAVGKSMRDISKELNRSVSTISAKICKGKYNAKYKATIADKRAIARRRKSHKHCKWRSYPLLNFIERHLKQKWSPEIIAHIWSRDHPQEKISHMFVYQIIRQHRIEWTKYLIYKGKKNYKTLHRAQVSRIPERVDISCRPEIINQRGRIGDIEADTVISERSGKSCIAVFVDRYTRYYWLVKMKDKSAAEMMRATLKALTGYPVKSITYDNGTENMNHLLVNQILGCESYFCRPYRSGDKGSIENRNKILRQFLPKKTNFDLISDQQLATIESLINNRPLKCLNWSAPSDLHCSF